MFLHEDSVYFRHERAMREKFSYRPSSVHYHCPRVVVGKRHLHPRRSRYACSCEPHQRLFDHGRMWLDSQGHHVLTGEPYTEAVHEGDRLDQLVALCAELGVFIDVSAADSLWFPGKTTLITISRGWR